ncbi:MAG: FtsQ-type POTRA domain-containing protein [Clostridia bacterium]|nr:FtsQ-type POTRA domain-containing protein [Clostridia bacterium]
MARKKKRKKHRKILSKVFVLLLLAISAVSVTLTTPAFKIKAVTVEGNSKIKAETIKAASEITENYNIFRISTHRAEKNIAEMPYIHSVQVKRRLPDKIIIKVEESKISGYIKTDKNLVGIDKYGKVVETLPLKAKPDEYIITGIKLKKSVPGEKILVDEKQNTDIILLYMETFEKQGISGNLKEVFIKSSADTGFVTKNGLTVKLGGTDGLEYKTKYYKRVLEEIKEEDGVLDLTSTDKALFHAN